MHQNSPRHLSKSSGWRWLGRVWAMPLALGMAALVGIVVLLAGLLAVTNGGSSPPTSRRAADATGSPAATSLTRNLVADASFDHDVDAWRPLPGAFLTRGSATQPAHAARVQRDPTIPAITDPNTGRALYGIVMPLIRSASRGTHIEATVQIRATRSQVPVLLRLSELAPGRTAAKSEARILLSDTAWRLLKVDREVSTAGATIQVEVGALALGTDDAMYVDNVRVSTWP